MSRTDKREGGLTRKELIGSGASVAAAALLAQGSGVERALAASKGKRRDVAGMNIIVFLTDQERAIQHFPPELAADEPAGAEAAAAPRPQFRNALL